MVMCQQPRKKQDTQHVIYRKQKVADLTPCISYNYLAEFYQIYIIKTHGSESRGQEEAACMRVFWPTRPLQ